MSNNIAAIIGTFVTIETMNEEHGQPLYADNNETAGIGCRPYAIAILAVCAFLVAIPIAMALLGWLSGGVRQ